MNTSCISSPPRTAPIYGNTQYRTCPRCKSKAIRIRRRSIDRFISHFRTVHRYQCLSLHCGWKGNLRPELTHSKDLSHAPSK